MIAPDLEGDFVFGRDEPFPLEAGGSLSPASLRYAVYDPAPTRPDEGSYSPNRFLVSDEAIVKALGLTVADVAALDRGALLTGSGPSFTPDGENATSVVLRTEAGAISVELVPMSGQPVPEFVSSRTVTCRQVYLLQSRVPIFTH